MFLSLWRCYMGLAGFEGARFNEDEEGFGGGEEAGGEDALAASGVADLLTQTSFPSSRPALNQPPLSSKTCKRVPFFAVPMTL